MHVCAAVGGVVGSVDSFTPTRHPRESMRALIDSHNVMELRFDFNQLSLW
jgi:hypothetical protein